MRAAIFDLDGTLADSVPDIAAALNGALADEGFAPFDVARVTSMVGAGARKLVERALVASGAPADPAQVERVHAQFIVHYDAHPCVLTKLYPGTRDALEQLVAQGWRLGVCTNKPEALALQLIEALGIAPLFGTVVGGRDGMPLKPAPDMVHLALQELGVSAGRAVFIGDSAADLGAGRAAGLPVVLMAHGYSDAPVAGMSAEAVVAGFDGLVEAVRRVAR
jgi:phosphoglycolate phosphatase